MCLARVILSAMKKICLCALGNPGEKYQATRHNIGFEIAKKYCDQHGLSLEKKTKLLAKVAIHSLENQQILILLPQTYMNLSGQSLQKVLAYYQIKVEDSLVIYDDIDLPFGHFRFREKGSAGTHNGMRSIVQCLKTLQVPRLRVGIGKPTFQALDQYVLSPFSATEKEFLPTIYQTALQIIDHYLTFPMQKFQEQYPKQIAMDKDSGSKKQDS